MKTLPALLMATSALSLPPARAVEYLNNGNFEGGFYTPGVPNGWKGNGNDGWSDFQEGVVRSPFTNLFPSSRYSVHLTDGASAIPGSDLGCFTSGVVPPRTAMSFEFSLSGASDSIWSLRLGYGNAPVRFDFGPGPYLYFGGHEVSSNIISSLTAATWYQVNAIVDVASGVVAGTVRPNGGAPVSFSRAIPAVGSATSVSVNIYDLSTGQNPTLYLDNISIRTVPEPSAAVLLLVGAVGMLMRRGAREVRP